jgi:hypothetical protein
MHLIGFSTGALACGDFRKALQMLQGSQANAIELSALRKCELEPLMDIVPDLDLSQFIHISVHAPGRFDADEEQNIINKLSTLAARGWPIILHPNAIHSYNRWRDLGNLLLIENMDKRKYSGRNVAEIESILKNLPEANLCFDIAHARQYDSSMSESYLILKNFNSLIKQIHISEVSTDSKHVRISLSAKNDFQEVSKYIPTDVPIILETPSQTLELNEDIEIAIQALSPEFSKLSN